jgi:hypothetical protein
MTQRAKERCMTTQEVLYTDEEILNATRANLNGTWFGTIAVLKQMGVPIDEFFTALGRLVAPGWEGVRGQGALAAARGAARSGVSFGATLESLTGDEHHAEVVASGWPPPELLRYLNLDENDVRASWANVRPVADFLGLDCRIERDGDRHIMTFTQKAAASQ